MSLNKMSRFVLWICSKFTRKEIEFIIKELSVIITNRNPEVRPKDDFKEKHPNYRSFYSDAKPPLTEPPKKKIALNYKDLLTTYKKEHKHPLKPVNIRNSKNSVPKHSICYSCNAPHQYLYFNNGKKRSQFKCKICNSVSPIHQRHLSSTKYFCPHCNYSLYLWKQRKDCSIYKCDNDNCPVYLSKKLKLNFAERMLQKIKSSQFKLHYQFREYHFTNEQLAHSSPEPRSNITNIRNSLNTLALILTFHVSFAISARKTAYLLREVFKIRLSYQSVLNYCEMAAYHCHKFNLSFKGNADNFQAGDETYIKINGEHNYTFFFISAKKLKITAYHVDNTRDTLPATIAINEAIRTANPNLKIFLVTDGNPSYQNAIHFLNQFLDNKLKLKNVIGLQNLDVVSTKFRPFKQLIERLNRTYKFHMRAAAGFSSKNGAVALTTLFVTFYNFLRPHMALDYNVPVPLDFFKGIDTLQGSWASIIQNAISL